MDTIITLTPVDAQAFVKFQKYYALFNAMEQAGVFDIESGKATINIMNYVPQNIVVERIAWKI